MLVNSCCLDWGCDGIASGQVEQNWDPRRISVCLIVLVSDLWFLLLLYYVGQGCEVHTGKYAMPWSTAMIPSHVVLICICLMTSNVGPLFMCSLAICIFFLEESWFKSFLHFLKLGGHFVIELFGSFIYSVYKSLIDIWFVNVFFHFVGLKKMSSLS